MPLRWVCRPLCRPDRPAGDGRHQGLSYTVCTVGHVHFWCSSSFRCKRIYGRGTPLAYVLSPLPAPKGPQVGNKQLDSAVDSFLKDLKQKYFAAKDQRQRKFVQIEAEVEQLWGNPLDLLDLQVGASRDTGRDFIDEHRDDALRSGDYAIQALSRLHVSACQTSQEILVLLRSGFADGALARWRTLHEAVVIATVIKKYGNESAERYLCHDVVHRYRSLNEMRDFLLNSDQEFTPDSEYDATETLFELYVCKFGKPFKLDYGWGRPHYSA